MNPKNKIIKKLQKNPEKYWEVNLFKERGFHRNKCKSCGNFFWSLDNSKKNCGDSSCQEYTFIENSPTKKKFDYLESWEIIKKFFVKNNHHALESYPTVCRWFPGLFFNIASIVSFQRMTKDRVVFEFPKNPLVIPQACIRFNDIPNVGVTGKHCTSFTMVGQHSISNKKGYWKDHCIQLDYELLTKVFGIKPEEITWAEDAWMGPGAFGYSLEYFVRGLEIGNAVFTEFRGTPNNYERMDEKIIDMGAGLERFAWISQGTPTVYDSIFGPVIDKLKSKIDYDKELFLKYSKLAGSLNIDEVKSGKKMKKQIASKIGISKKELEKQIQSLMQIYSLTDHTRTLLFTISDGALPSNVGGGYNLRVILRRMFSFQDELEAETDITEIAEDHAKYLKKIFPNIDQGLDKFQDIIETERRRFQQTKKRNKKIIQKAVREKLTEEKLIELYESRGITPELIKEEAGKKDIDIPEKFYQKLSQKHTYGKTEKEKTPDVPETQMLFYEDQKKKRFKAKVIKSDGNKIILDKTYFYPESGGQESDKGFLDKKAVKEVQKKGNVIIHILKKGTIEEGKEIIAEINIKRRGQLEIHHTATHIINAVARDTLGKHIYQAGAKKGVDEAHLDITHYKKISEKELNEIEKEANKVIKKNITVEVEKLKRTKAEKKYGLSIYQGGPVPRENLRIVKIGKIDVEACGGLHLTKTGDAEKIIIKNSKRVQDGISRIEFVSGPQAEKYMEKMEKIMKKTCEILDTKEDKVLEESKRIFSRWKKLRKKIEEEKEKEAEKKLNKLEFKNNILVKKIKGVKMDVLKEMSKKLSNQGKVILLFGVSDKIYIFGSSNNGINIGKIVSKLCKELGGKGGGNKNLGQGIGKDKDKLDEVIENIRNELK